MENGYFTDTIFSRYYKEVGRHDVLTSEEERALLVRYFSCPSCGRKLPHVTRTKNCPKCGNPTPPRITGNVCKCTQCNTKYMKQLPPKHCQHCGSGRDLEAREKLIVSNLRFVVASAKKLTPRLEYVRRLVSAGNVGLIIALDKFNLNLNTKFLTYAAWWIRKEMLDEIHASGLVHVPSHKQKSLSKQQKQGDHVCVHCGIRTSNPYDSDVMCIAESHEFIKTDTQGCNAINAIFSIENVQIPVPETSMESGAICESGTVLIRKIVNKIPLRVRDRFIFLQYYNIPKEDRRTESKTLPKLAAITNITPERVRQIKMRILRTVQNELRLRGITQTSDIWSG